MTLSYGEQSDSVRRLDELEQEFVSEMTSARAELQDMASGHRDSIDPATLQSYADQQGLPGVVTASHLEILNDGATTPPPTKQHAHNHHPRDNNNNNNNNDNNDNNDVNQDSDDSLFWAQEDETLANLSDSFTLSNPEHTTSSSSTPQHDRTAPAPLIDIQADSLTEATFGFGDSFGSSDGHKMVFDTTDKDKDNDNDKDTAAPLMGTGDFRNSPDSKPPTSPRPPPQQQEGNDMNNLQTSPVATPSANRNGVPRNTNRLLEESDTSLTMAEALPGWQDPNEAMPEWKNNEPQPYANTPPPSRNSRTQDRGELPPPLAAFPPQPPESSPSPTTATNDRALVVANGTSPRGAKPRDVNDTATATTDPSLMIDRSPPYYTVNNGHDNNKSPSDEDRKQSPVRPIVAAVMACLAVIVAVVLSVVFLVVVKDNDSPPAAATTTLPPADYYTAIPFLPNYTTAAMLANGLSPQAQAYRWLLDNPNFSVSTVKDMTDDEKAKLLQRFAMATFYFALRGENWTTTTTPTLVLSYDVNECDWLPSISDRGGIICGGGSSNTGTTNTNSNNSNDNTTVAGGQDDDKDNENSEASSNNNSTNTTASNNTEAASSNSTGTDTITITITGEDAETEPEATTNNSTESNVDIGSNNNSNTVDEPPTAIAKSNIFIQNRNSGIPDDSSQRRRQRFLRSQRLLQSTTDNPTAANSNWQVVTGIHLPGYNLVGTLPPELALLTGLTSMDLSHNSVFGTIPTQTFAGLSKLTNLNISFNILSGSIPENVILLSNLEILDASMNKFTKGIPSGLVSLARLLHLDLSDNQIAGPLPTVLGGALTTLRLQLNGITGSIPQGVSSSTNLVHLELDNNKLDGILPSELGLLQNLETLLLYENDLKGPIPSEIGLMESLQVLALSENHIDGKIPTQLGLLESLQSLWLNGNDLSGQIPVEVGNLVERNDGGALRNIILYQNNLTGVVPPKLCLADEIQFDCGAELCGCDCNCSGAAGGNVSSTGDGTNSTEVPTEPTQAEPDVGSVNATNSSESSNELNATTNDPETDVEEGVTEGPISDTDEDEDAATAAPSDDDESIAVNATTAPTEEASNGLGGEGNNNTDTQVSTNEGKPTINNGTISPGPGERVP